MNKHDMIDKLQLLRDHCEDFGSDDVATGQLADTLSLIADIFEDHFQRHDDAREQSAGASCSRDGNEPHWDLVSCCIDSPFAWISAITKKLRRITWASQCPFCEASGSDCQGQGTHPDSVVPVHDPSCPLSPDWIPIQANRDGEQ